MENIKLGQKFPTNTNTVIAVKNVGNHSVVLCLNDTGNAKNSLCQNYTVWTVCRADGDNNHFNHYHGVSFHNIIDSSAVWSQRLSVLNDKAA